MAETQKETIDGIFVLHKLAVEGARQNPEGRVGVVEDAVPLDTSVTPSPKKCKAPTKERCYRHSSGERKQQIRASIMSGSSHRNTSRILGISLGSISRTMHNTPDELFQRHTLVEEEKPWSR